MLSIIPALQAKEAQLLTDNEALKAKLAATQEEKQVGSGFGHASSAGR
jgi:hypothetical protein